MSYFVIFIVEIVITIKPVLITNYKLLYTSRVVCRVARHSTIPQRLVIVKWNWIKKRPSAKRVSAEHYLLNKKKGKQINKPSMSKIILPRTYILIYRVRQNLYLKNWYLDQNRVPTVYPPHLQKL